MVKRESNIELLRIVAILMVTIYHFAGYSMVHDTKLDVSLATIITGFVYAGVNVFVLITGYFGIRMSVKGLGRLFIIVSFYGTLSYLFNAYVMDLTIGKSLLYSIFFPFSHTMSWFVRCYVILYMLSPILNKAIDHFSKQYYILVLLLLTGVNVYFGYFWQCPECSVDGYTVSQFVYMYMIGGYLKRYYIPEQESRHSIKTYRAKMVCVYMLSSICWVCATLLNNDIVHIPFWYPFSYNNPLLILSGCSLLCLFSSFKFENSFVTFISPGVLAVYLVQDATYFRTYVRECVGEICNYVYYSANVWVSILVMILVSVAFVFAILFIDKFRVWICKPLYKFVNVIDSKIDLSILRQ